MQLGPTPSTTPLTAEELAKRQKTEEKAKAFFKQLLIVGGFIFAGYLALSSTPALITLSTTSSYASQLIALIINASFPFYVAAYCMGLYLQALKTFEIWPLENSTVSFLPADMWQDIKYAAKTFDWLLLKKSSKHLRDTYFPQVKQFLEKKPDHSSTSEPSTGIFDTLKNGLNQLIDNIKTLVSKLEKHSRPGVTGTAIAAKIHQQCYIAMRSGSTSVLAPEVTEREFLDYFKKHLTSGTYLNKGLVETVVTATFAEIKDYKNQPTRSAPR